MKENAALCVVVLALVSHRGLSIDGEQAKMFLLPGDMKPTHYNVHLITKIDKFDLRNESSFTFDGEIQIFMNSVKDNVTDLVLNVGEVMTVRETNLHRPGWNPVSLGNGNYNGTTEKVTFPLPFTVDKGESLRFDINFTARHYQEGFVYNLYYGKNDSKRWFVYTDLEPSSARFVFPCFDEPKYKATYNVSVSVPTALVSDGYHALSNAAETCREKVGKNTIIHFKKTLIPMSTYLFAVVVSDYTSTKPRYFNGTRPDLKRGQLKTWAKPDTFDTHDGNFAQAAALALIKIYTEDFGTGYNFGKIDQVAVPGYPQAMENWGLVLYWGELLAEPNEISAGIIAHELCHQWFGNLVTLHWWSDVWLKEGFATYLQYFAADKINEEGINGKLWNLPYQFVIKVVQIRGMHYDVPEANNHPLTVEVYDPKEYPWYFDTISYEKAAAVIYMWKNIFGEKAFEKVIRHYLSHFQEGVTTPEELLGCFDRYANESESDLNGMKPHEMFRNWHMKAGLPIVSVRKMKENPSTYVLTQDVFRLNKGTQVEEAEWTIPISYSTSDNFNFNSTKVEIWLTPGKKQILKLAKPVRWIVVNNQQSGYYRVNYNIENWKELYRVLNESEHEIHEINRAQIIDDSLEIAKSSAFDYLPYNDVLDMLLYLRKEPSYFPWKSALNKLEFLKSQLLKDESVYPLFRMFVLDLLSNRVESSWLVQHECDANNDHKFEKDILHWACEMGHPSCSLQTKSLFNTPQGQKGVCVQSLDVTYCTYIRSNSDSITWDEVWNDYETTEDENIKKSLLRGLGCAKNGIILKRLLEKSIDSSSKLYNKERNGMVSAVLKGNAENVETLLNFFEVNVNQLMMALSRRYLEWDIFLDVAEKLSTHDEISRMRKLAIDLGKSSKTKVASDKMLQITTRIMSANNEWQNIKSKSVSDWLITRYSSRRNSL